jgi:hypothetical protein
MDKREDGGPAFPTADYRTGMSLRDWFAGQALAGILAGAFIDSSRLTDGANFITQNAYQYADAMLAARGR